MHLVSPLLLRAARRTGQLQSISKEGQQNTSISAATYGAALEAELGETANPGETNILVRASLLTATSMLPELPCTLLSFSSLYTSLPHLFYYEGPMSMPLILPVYSRGMLSLLFSDNSRLVISAQPSATLASFHTCPGLG